MNIFRIKFRLTILFVTGVLISSAQQVENPVVIVAQPKQTGPSLGYSSQSGVRILKADGLLFKDLNKNGVLDKYEDWRLPVEIRAKDLAQKMTNEQIAGLMLFGDHQAVNSSQPTDLQKKMVNENGIRSILLDKIESTETAVEWNNHIQSLAEELPLGIPLNNGSDPRHTIEGSEGINGGAGGTISKWPDGLGLAATFDPSLIQKFGAIAAKEYRALGIATALSPQIDLGSEPRWFRIEGTFGEGVSLTTDMARAYIDGFQTSSGKDEISDGWGWQSVNCIVKHWPGGGPVEGGRDAHFSFGKFAVYPGNNFQTQLKPFINGAFKLTGKTKKAAAVMPYYTIPFDQDTLYGENVGNGFSKYIVTDLLRKQYDYDGVVCTDFHITGGRKWGVEKLSVAELHYKTLMAGVDQIGGVYSVSPMLKAIQMGIDEHGEEWMRKRLEASAERLLRNIFQVGLFENPYLDIKESAQIVGAPDFVKAGYEAQLKSVILLKNQKKVLPLSRKTVVYIPKIFTPAGKDPMGKIIPESYDYPIDLNIVKEYFEVTEDPNKAEAAIVFAKGPDGGLGYDRKTNTYVPISLQYGAYTSEFSRAQSIAVDDPKDPANTNRSYLGKSVTSTNEGVLTTILDTKKQMGTKPVIVALTLVGPAIVAEFEKQIQGLVVTFGEIQSQAMLDILSGRFQPSGLLPVQMPANMKTVEEQQEDVPLDMECYRDTEGRTYDFGYGLNWKGVIKDWRTKKYKDGK